MYIFGDRKIVKLFYLTLFYKKIKKMSNNFN